MKPFSVIRRLMGRVARIVDDIPPMPNHQRVARDNMPMEGDEVARRRRLRLKLQMLEKRGKGGYR